MTSLLSENDRAALLAASGGQVRFDEAMSRHTTLKIGGPADALVTPATREALARVLAESAQRSLPVFPLGAGSNLLVLDGGIRGVVISTRGLRGLRRTGDVTLEVEAGLSTGKLLSEVTKWELGGLEFLGGVPGSVGGGLIMNAGTYLGEFTSVVTEVRSLCIADGGEVARDHSACGFVYRGSDLPADEIVVSATLTLWPRSGDEIREEVRALRQRRKEREPKGGNNAGSVFKNPPGDFAGRLLEAVGMKGTRVGAAECSPVHANWFVNHGGATAADMLTLMEMARKKVKDISGVVLTPEWKIVGEPMGEQHEKGRAHD